MDKKIIYALIGGAAVAATAVALRFLTLKSKEDNIDEICYRKIQELLPLERDHLGYISFSKFLEIFEICSVYGKSKFLERKKQFI